MDVYKRLQEIRSTAKGGQNFSFSKEECDKFWELYTNNLSIRKIAKAMNCKPGKIQAIERRLKLPKVIYFQSQKELILTEEEEAVIIGSLLGDGHITKSTKNRVNGRFTFSHCEWQKDYCLHKKNYLNRLKSGELTWYNCIIKSTGSINPTITFTTFCHPKFNEIRNIFYPNGKKIIPIDYIRDKYTAQSLAMHYLDDGHKRTGSKRSRMICTDSFPPDNLQEYCDFIIEKFGINVFIIDKNRVRIDYRDSEKFVNLIAPYVPECMKYKL